MKAEIIAVGTELLLGDILNTNAQFLSKELAKLGIGVFYQTVVGDNPDRLLSAFEIAFSRADVVITTGGLGPTDDDLTKETASKYFNKKMIMDQKSLEHIESFFNRQQFEMTENNKKQGMIPEGSKIIPNAKGTAPGCWIEENGKILIMLPGPPSEAIPMFENEVIPCLKEKTEGVFFSKTLRICGVGESAVADMLKDMLNAQENPTIAPYAKTFEVHLRLTASAKNEEEAKALIAPVSREIYSRLGKDIYGEDETTLEASLINKLVEKGMKIACAESCTGGLLAAKLVDFPGASKAFTEGVVTYSNESKINRLGVKKETLDKFGAVSEEVAKEMAQGVAKTCGVDMAIATTGVAGPESGTEEKPVGLVYIALWVKGEVHVKKLNIVGDRARVRQRSVIIAIDFARRVLTKMEK